METTRPTWLDDRLFPFTSRYADVLGHRMHYVDEGEGPILLMIHGNPTWSFLYREVISRLRGRFRCIAIDLPGYGLSTARPGYLHRPPDQAEAVAAFVERLDLQDVTLVVHDWGGPIGFAAAEAHPERYSRLVVTNTWAWPADETRMVLFSRLVGGPLGRVLIRRFNLFVNAFIPIGHRRRTPTAAEMRHWRRALETPKRRQASAVLPRAITAEHAFLARVETGLDRMRHLPSLLLWADADFAFQEHARARWQALLDDRTDVTVHGAGHYVPSDAGEEFAQAIDAWLPAVG